MAENSFFWEGTTLTDAGPYETETMYKVLAQLARAGNAESLASLYDFGIFYFVANNLEPTINGTNIDVDTGASLADGAYHENDTTVSVPIIAAAAGNEREDYIVVRKNYQAAVTYTPGGGAPTVLPQTSRITVIRGVECVSPCNPATPSLIQSTTRTDYWDIPIATIEVNDAGVLSSLVDKREFVDAETKKFFVPALGGRNITDGTDITLSATGGTEFGIILPDAKNAFGAGRIRYPQDYISDLIVTGLVTAETVSGVVNIYIVMSIAAGACDEALDTHAQDNGLSAVAFNNILTGVYKCLRPITVAIGDINDILTLIFFRDATNVLDTNADGVIVMGFLVEYFGWKK